MAAALAIAAQSAAAREADPWSRSLVKRGIDPGLIENPIAVTPEIRAAAEQFSGGGAGTVDQLRRMQSALFDSSRFTFVYEAGLTETASEALRSGRGNCVAFTNLFIAMARSRGLRVKAGYLTPRAAAAKHGDLVYRSAHVVAVYPLHDRYVVFDFYRVGEDHAAHIRLLDDFELAALTVNNRAVEALSAGDFDSADKLLSAALKLAPDFAAAHGNLGVLRRRRGDIPGAIDEYRQALAIEPRDPSVLGNLAALYNGIGRTREAKAALELADLTLATPYTILARGDLEAADGRYDDALRFYRRAARLDPGIPDPQVAIARLARAAGHPDEARRAALRAIKIDPANGEAKTILDGLTAAASP